MNNDKELCEPNPTPCTCHPDDRPKGPCPRKYAASECQTAARIEALQAELKTWQETAATYGRAVIRLQARVEELEGHWIFLRERLRELDFDQEPDDLWRDFAGHVNPAIARMDYLIGDRND